MVLGYTSALCFELLKGLFRDYEGNWDYLERGQEPPRKPRLSSSEFRSAAAMVRKAAPASALYDMVEDDASRGLIVKLLAYKALGHQRVKLPRKSGPDDVARADACVVGDAVIKIPQIGAKLRRRDLRSLGHPLNLFCTSLGAVFTFVQEQYALRRGDAVCCVEKDDIVIDAGACWGDTSLYFAGKAKRVYAFEFMQNSLAILRHNLALNPWLAEKIEIIEKPIWDTVDHPVFYVDWGPGSRVSSEKMEAFFPDTKAMTTTIDHVVETKAIQRVDFIKMDIEGAERHALMGARNTIARFRPKLAVSLYHRVDDFWVIPSIIESMGVPYRYFIDHHTVYENETVLFALPA